MGKSKFNPINIVQKTVAAVREKKDTAVGAVTAPVNNSPVLKGVANAVGTYYMGAAGLATSAGGMINSYRKGDYLGVAAGGKENTDASWAKDNTISGNRGSNTVAGTIKSTSGAYEDLQDKNYQKLATDFSSSRSIEGKIVMDAAEKSLKGSTDPGAIGGEMSTFAAPPSEDPNAQKAAADAAAEQSRPKGVSSTIFAGLNETQGPNSPKRKSARKTLLGY